MDRVGGFEPLGCRFESCRARQFFIYSAGVVELADTLALGASGVILGGSNPSARTSFFT